MYNSVLVTKLINSVMLDGKKGVAQKVVYDAFDIIKEKTGKEPLDAFTEAMNNIMPSLEVKARRVGGATYQVPMEVRPERRQTLGLRWLTGYARKRSEKTMKERLAGEIMDACNNTGAAVKKREDTHKMAESNKATVKSTWPGVSMILMRLPFQKQVVAALVIVMPRSCSSDPAADRLRGGLPRHHRPARDEGGRLLRRSWQGYARRGDPRGHARRGRRVPHAAP